MIEFQDVHGAMASITRCGIASRHCAGEFFAAWPVGLRQDHALRTIAGFEDISSGAVLIDGKHMQGVPANKRPTNMVFQSYAIFPDRAWSVAFGLRRDRGARGDSASWRRWRWRG
ncbi:MAG: hypothetical protein R3D53_07600 [Paracoccaceae bacterium]